MLALLPHLHVRGTAFRYFLKPPGGEWQTLLDVPRYDFSWQLVYFFDKPLDIPAGSEIYCEGVYDNSVENRNNPDPKARVQWGPETTSEMLVGYLIAIDPASEGKGAEQYRFPLEAFGAPLDRAWEIAAGSERASLKQSDDAEGEIRLEISNGPTTENVVIRRPIVPLKQGATYKIAFEARASEKRSLEVRAEDRQRQAAGGGKSIELGREWKRHDFFFEAGIDALEPYVAFKVGKQAGTVELRATVVLQGAHR